jgi:hypothetical protein
MRDPEVRGLHRLHELQGLHGGTCFQISLFDFASNVLVYLARTIQLAQASIIAVASQNHVERGIQCRAPLLRQLHRSGLGVFRCTWVKRRLKEVQ